MMIDLTDIVIVQSNYGSDAVFLKTKLPSPIWPFENQYLTMDFHAARDFGEEYCKINFPEVPLTILKRLK